MQVQCSHFSCVQSMKARLGLAGGVDGVRNGNGAPLARAAVDVVCRALAVIEQSLLSESCRTPLVQFEFLLLPAAMCLSSSNSSRPVRYASPPGGETPCLPNMAASAARQKQRLTELESNVTRGSSHETPTPTATTKRSNRFAGSTANVRKAYRTGRRTELDERNSNWTRGVRLRLKDRTVSLAQQLM